MFDLKHCFPGQKKDEKVFIFLRRHPAAFIPFLLIILLMVMIPLVLLLFGLDSFPGIKGGIGRNFLVLGTSFYYLFLCLFSAVVFLDFYFDVHIVTSERVIDIDQHGLFSRRIDELSLAQVEDVSYSIRGILPTVFNYGKVEVQTAGTERNFFLEDIPYPEKIAQKILDLSEKIAKPDD